MKQLGASSPIYQSGTDRYQEGGLLPLLALGGGLIPSLMKQLGDGSPTYQSGTDPYQEGGFLLLSGLGGLLPGLMKQLGAGASSKKKKTSHAHHAFLDPIHPAKTVSPSRRSQRGSVA